MNRIETYVVPWDFSEHSKAALQYAIQRFPGQEIKVVCGSGTSKPILSRCRIWDERRDDGRQGM